MYVNANCTNKCKMHVIKSGNDFLRLESFENRLEMTRRIKERYSSRIPIIVLQPEHNNNIPKLSQYKYLVPDDLTVSQFMFVLRKRIKLDHSKALFMFVNRSVLLNGSMYMDLVYNQYKSDDGFLYITLAGENTFGSVSEMVDM